MRQTKNRWQKAIQRVVWVLAPCVTVAWASAPEWAVRAPQWSEPWRGWLQPAAEQWAQWVNPEREVSGRTVVAAAAEPVPLPVQPLVANGLTVDQPDDSRLKTETAETLSPPKVVVAIGDSLMAAVADGLRHGLPPEIRLVDVSRVSTGLSNTGYFDWAAAAETAVRDHAADWLVVHMGANDAQDLRVTGGWIRFDTDAWKAEYTARTLNLVTRARAQHPDLRVVWLSLPPMRDQAFERRMGIVASAQAPVCMEVGVVCVAATAVLGPQFVREGAGINGRRRVWRADDGIHYSVEGGRRLAEGVVSQLPSWPWRASP